MVDLMDNRSSLLLPRLNFAHLYVLKSILLCMFLCLSFVFMKKNENCGNGNVADLANYFLEPQFRESSNA